MNKKREEINEFILASLKENSRGISARIVQKFDINRRTAVDYLRALIDDHLIVSEGRTKARTYHLRTLIKKSWTIPITRQTEEHKVWREILAPQLDGVNENVGDLCAYGFQEMLNNVIDHSETNQAQITLSRDPASIEMTVDDDGVGIFEKIRAALDLSDPREALLELSKGKFTTAPERHSGEGIFFTSRMFDKFLIRSRGLHYYAEGSKQDDWIFERGEEKKKAGTAVYMTVSAFSKRTREDIFNRFSGVEAGFFRTHVSLKLAIYGQEKLVSRSQARRVLARFDKFGEVLLDFVGVPSIGQPFADEIFRVFALEHPEIRIVDLHASAQVKQMIAWVRGARGMQGPLL